MNDEVRYDTWRKTLHRDIDSVKAWYLCFETSNPADDKILFGLEPPGPFRGQLLTATAAQFFDFYSVNQDSYQKLRFLDNDNYALQARMKFRRIPNVSLVGWERRLMQYVVIYQDGNSEILETSTL